MIITSKVLQRLIDEEFSQAYLERQLRRLREATAIQSIGQPAELEAEPCPVCEAVGECDPQCPTNGSSEGEPCPTCGGTNTEHDEMPSMMGYGADTSLTCNDCGSSFSDSPMGKGWYKHKKTAVSEARDRPKQLGRFQESFDDAYDRLVAVLRELRDMHSMDPQRIALQACKTLELETGNEPKLSGSTSDTLSFSDLEVGMSVQYYNNKKKVWEPAIIMRLYPKRVLAKIRYKDGETRDAYASELRRDDPLDEEL